MRRLLLAAAALLVGCTESSGALTAKLVFPQTAATGVPEEIERLEIRALDVEGSTLAATTLAITPAEGEEELLREGGAWRLGEVPVGDDRTVRATAFLGSVGDPRFDGMPALSGEVTGLTVRPSAVTNAGNLELQLLPGVRLPSLDFESPGAPAPLRVTIPPQGERLVAEISAPPDEDVEGYVVAIARSLGIAPSIERGAALPVEGEDLLPGYTVLQVHEGSDFTSFELDGLENGELYVLLVYAYDTRFDQSPLNYSGAAEAIATPNDTMPPGSIDDLLLTATATGTEITFTAPGEDDSEGTPARYEARVSHDRAALADPATFGVQRTIMTPAASAPGDLVRFFASFEALDALGQQVVYLGIRAVDAAQNAGPIAIASLDPAALPPFISSTDPEVALSGTSIVIHGTRFGNVMGTVELLEATSSAAVSLESISWSNELIVAAVPAGSRSGTLLLASSDGAVGSRPLSIVSRGTAPLSGARPIFSVVADGAPSGVDAIYRATDGGGSESHAVDRYRDGAFVDALLPFVSTDLITAVAGDYSKDLGLFFFVASTTATETMSAALLSGSDPASEMRIPGSVRTGAADSLALEILDPVTSGFGALLAFTKNGALRTAVVDDVRIEPFNAFVVQDQTGSDLVRLSRRVTPSDPTQSPILLAYRKNGTALTLMDAAGDGRGVGDFVQRAGAGPLEIGDQMQIVDVPSIGFVIAYEEISQSGVEVRLLRADDYGAGPGYAPLVASNSDRGLEGVGVIDLGGANIIVLLTTRRSGDIGQLNYAEIPASELTADGRGSHAGLDLDFADAKGGLACRTDARECSIYWLGEQDPRIAYRRR